MTAGDSERDGDRGRSATASGSGRNGGRDRPSAAGSARRFPKPGRVRRIARTELRRTYRRLSDDGARFGLMILAGLFLVLYSLGLGVGGYFLAASGNPAAVPVARGVAVGFLALAAFLSLQRTVKTTGDPDGLEGLLTTVPAVDVVAGMLLAEFAYGVAVIAFPAACIAVGLAAGAGSVVPAFLFAVVTALLLAAGLLVGYVLGLSIKHLVARSAFVARRKALLATLASLAFPLAYFVGIYLDPVVAAVGDLAVDLPLSWPADAVLVTVPGADGSPARAAAGIAGLGAGTVALAGVGTVLARSLWYLDPVRPPEIERETRLDDEETPLGRLLAGRVAAPTRHVIRKSWRRARRAPFTVQFAFAPFLLVGYLGLQAFLTGSVPSLFVYAVAVGGALATGGAFALNPLGGEGPVLPIVLTADVDGRAFVNGLALAGLLPGLPVTVLLVLAVGAALSLPPVELAPVAAASVVLCLAAPGVAAAAGVLFPKFEAATVTWNREAVVPSTIAFVGYSFVLSLLAVPLLLSSAVATTSPVPEHVALPVGLAITVALAAVFGYGGLRYATGEVAEYRLD